MFLLRFPLSITRLSLLSALFIALPNRAIGQESLPPSAPKFRGTINLRESDSQPSFPAPIVPPAGAPNIVLILTDDVGFGASSTFGGPIATPVFDALAAQGLRYNQFHTTALCSPTRAALLTGRNHHTCASGMITELSTGFPGYNSMIPRSCASIVEILRQTGYATAAFGKWHNTPDWEVSSAGPFDRWPTHQGFQYFYGFHGGDTNQYAPALYEGTTAIEPYLGRSDYLLNDDLASRASAWVREQTTLAPDCPFFLYLAPGGTHAPHHAPRALIEKQRGKFDQGWDAVRQATFERQKQLGVIPPGTQLTPRPKEIKAWASLKPDQQRLFARMMEVYAAFLEHTDQCIGRVIDAVRASGRFDNTLVIFIQGDNGASAEGTPNGLYNELTFFNGIFEDYRQLAKKLDDLGGPRTYNHYPAGWAHAMDTPFQWTKQIASHYGGTRNGMVVCWPDRIKQPGLRSQWHHVIDIAPTILEATGIAEPDSVNGTPQRPMEGVSVLYSFADPAAESRHRQQYFEMIGNRGMYHDGWLAATTPRNMPWNPFAKRGDVIDDWNWELYHVADDFSEAMNLAEKEPAKLRDLQALFYAEAARYNVLPLDDRRGERTIDHNHSPLSANRSSLVYQGPLKRISEAVAPNLRNRSFTITASIIVPEGGGNGMLATQGGRFGGWGLWLDDGKPRFHYNLAGFDQFVIAANNAVPAGKHSVAFDFKYAGGRGEGGLGTLSVDGQKVAEGRIERTLPGRISTDESLDLGCDTGTGITAEYQLPYPFTGTLESVTFDLK